MTAFDLSAWARSIEGKGLDLDGAPASNPIQCHDVWLSYLYALGGRPGDGHAPGTEYTHEVWRHFPTHRPNLANLFTKHTGTAIRRGDVVFWSAYVEGGGLPHVAVALDPPSGGRVRVVTQDAGRFVELKPLSTSGVLGVLRPRAAIGGEHVMTPEQEKRIMDKIEAASLRQTGPSHIGWLKRRLGGSTASGPTITSLLSAILAELKKINERN